VSVVTPSRPPSGIASRALTARLSTICSSWSRSTLTHAAVRASAVHDGDVLADQAPQHLRHVDDHGVEV
jgi:hypothetical protein